MRTARCGASGARQRIVEEDHQAVAGEALERALEAVDEVAERRVVLAAARAITSSGSAVSANAVKPRRSQKTTVISRRWLSRNDSSPEMTTSSASCGDRNRRSRPSRSSSLDLLARRAARAPVPRGELGGLRLDRVVVALDAQQRAHAGQQLGLVERLGDEVVGAGLDRARASPARRWR